MEKYNTPLSDKEKLKDIYKSVNEIIKMIEGTPLEKHQMKFDLDYISMLSSGVTIWHS
ncbi:MAG: hypothetical protein J6S67_10375 [Methanobrevibacter sp.]|nr:hypothetical protein [Methanobrevibacter sp.]